MKEWYNENELTVFMSLCITVGVLAFGYQQDTDRFT